MLRLRTDWASLRHETVSKGEQIAAVYNLQQMLVEASETASWIGDKKKLVESTDSLSGDLVGVMQLQRRLSGFERDLAAIEAKKTALESDAHALREAIAAVERSPRLLESAPSAELTRSERVAQLLAGASNLAELRAQAERLEQRLQPVRELWGELNGMMQAREERLTASSELQQFLQKLDLFQLWLSRGQAAAASSDLPAGKRICFLRFT